MKDFQTWAHTFGRGQRRNWRTPVVFLNYVRSSASDKAAGRRMITEWKFGILRGMEEGFDNGRKGPRSSTARQMIDCRAVGEGSSCFGCRLVGMTAMVSSIFEKMRLAGSAIYNGDILLLGFFSFAFLNYEIDDTYRKVHPDLLSCHFCSISMSFSLFFFFWMLWI